jgi:hypothetical protein
VATSWVPGRLAANASFSLDTLKIVRRGELLKAHGPVSDFPAQGSQSSRARRILSLGVSKIEAAQPPGEQLKLLDQKNVVPVEVLHSANGKLSRNGLQVPSLVSG